MPCWRMVSIAAVGKWKEEQGRWAQSAKGEEKASSEAPLRDMRSNLKSAFMSQGGASPVSCLPITAPQ